MPLLEVSAVGIKEVCTHTKGMACTPDDDFSAGIFNGGNKMDILEILLFHIFA